MRHISRRRALVSGASLFGALVLAPKLTTPWLSASRCAADDSPRDADEASRVDLAGMRELARHTPIDQLRTRWLELCEACGRRFRDDRQLRIGLERLARDLLHESRPADANARLRADAIAQVIELGEPGLRVQFAPWAQALRRLTR